LCQHKIGHFVAGCQGRKPAPEVEDSEGENNAFILVTRLSRIQLKTYKVQKSHKELKYDVIYYQLNDRTTQRK